MIYQIGRLPRVNPYTKKNITDAYEYLMVVSFYRFIISFQTERGDAIDSWVATEILVYS